MANDLTLSGLLQQDQVIGRVEAGLCPDAAAQKAKLLADCARALVGAGEAADKTCVAVFVPGRIEVLGKHTDYAGGSSILCATEVGFCSVAVAKDKPTVTIQDVARRERIELALEADLPKRQGHWSNYPITVIRRVIRDFGGKFHGAAIAFASDLPPAAGVSSSSALIVSMFLVLDDVNELESREAYRQHIQNKIDLAGYLGTVESGYAFGSFDGDGGVGLFGGSEDQTAILCSQPGHVVRYAYCPVRFERSIRLPETHVFVIASCGVEAEKAGAARESYNRASLLAKELAAIWREATGRDEEYLAAALATGSDAADRLREIARASCHGTYDAQSLSRRLEHFILENQVILPQATEALARGDLAQFGLLVDRSQRGAEDLLDNQIEPTRYLAAHARQLGATAASAFGAGFGGSVWALVEKTQAAEFMARWRTDYQSAFRNHAAASRFLLTHAGPAAFRL